MVRLKDHEKGDGVGEKKYFNSTMVRLKVDYSYFFDYCIEHFNSTMVRLKDYSNNYM